MHIDLNHLIYAPPGGRPVRAIETRNIHGDWMFGVADLHGNVLEEPGHGDLLDLMDALHEYAHLPEFTLEDLEWFQGYSQYCLDGLEDVEEHEGGRAAYAKLNSVISRLQHPHTHKLSETLSNQQERKRATDEL